jgi:hypothetical protein
VPEAPLPNFAHAVELVAVEDSPRLQLLVALDHAK